MLVIVIGVATGCSSREMDFQTAELGKLEFAAPAHWKRLDTRTRDSATAQWTPEENEHKESLVVIQSRQTAASKTDRVVLEHLLVSAQRALPKARVGDITAVTSEHGLAGLSIEVTFVPVGLRHEYHRSHTVLVDEATLINIIYTARKPERSHTIMSALLSTIRHREG